MVGLAGSPLLESLREHRVKIFYDDFGLGAIKEGTLVGIDDYAIRLTMAKDGKPLHILIPLTRVVRVEQIT